MQRCLDKRSGVGIVDARRRPDVHSASPSVRYLRMIAAQRNAARTQNLYSHGAARSDGRGRSTERALHSEAEPSARQSAANLAPS